MYRDNIVHVIQTLITTKFYEVLMEKRGKFTKILRGANGKKEERLRKKIYT